MFIREITFGIDSTMPLEPLTGNSEDRYANVKPMTSVTVSFGPEECNPAIASGKKLLEKAFELAQDASFNAAFKFREDFRALLAKK